MELVGWSVGASLLPLAAGLLVFLGGHKTETKFAGEK